MSPKRSQLEGYYAIRRALFFTWLGLVLGAIIACSVCLYDIHAAKPASGIVVSVNEPSARFKTLFDYNRSIIQVQVGGTTYTTEDFDSRPLVGDSYRLKLNRTTGQTIGYSWYLMFGAICLFLIVSLPWLGALLVAYATGNTELWRQQFDAMLHRYTHFKRPR